MNFKKIFFAFFILVAFSQVNAQSSAIQWLNTIPSSPSNYQEISFLEVDNNNLYVTGSYLGNSVTIGNQTLTSEGRAIYMAKLNGQGSVIWAKNIASGDFGGISDFVTDKLGNFYIYGHYNWYITIGNITLDSSTSPGSIFLAKFDAEGNIIWAKKAGGDCNGCYAYTRDMVLDSNNDIIITGNFEGSEINFGNNSLSKAGERDGFITKYDQNGNNVWVKIFKGNLIEDYASLTADLSGNIFVGGSFTSTNFSIGDVNLQNNGESNIYFAKLNTDGNTLWAKSYGGSGAAYVNQIYSDTLGNIIMLGDYTASFSIDNTQINKIGNYDIFITKFTKDGNLIWSKTIGTQEGVVRGSKLGIDPTNNIYASGITSQSITIGNTTIQNQGILNSFLTKLDSEGNFKTAMGIHSTHYVSTGVNVNPSGNVYLVGYFDQNLNIDNQSFTTDVYALFFTKLNNNTLGTDKYVNNSHAIYPNPSKDILNLPYNTTETNTDYTIIDSTGRIVKNGTTYNNTINVESLPKGLYILNTGSKMGIKFIKE